MLNLISNKRIPNHRTPPSISRLLLAVAFGFAASSNASAQSQSAEQAACIDAMGQRFEAVEHAQHGLIKACVREKSRGQANSVYECIDADPGNKIANRFAGTLRAEQKNCGGEAPDFGYSSGQATNEEAAGAALGLAHSLFGDDLDQAIVERGDDRDSRRASQCQQKVLKAAGQCSATLITDFNSCVSEQLTRGGGEIDYVACKGAPTDALATTCETNVDQVVAEQCAGQDTAALFPGCGAVDLATCVLAKATASPSLGLNVAGGVCEAPPVNPAPPEPERFVSRTVPVPAEFEEQFDAVTTRLFPAWTADGSRIVFQHAPQKLALVAEDGSNFVELPVTIPAEHKNKPIAFNDGSRLLVDEVIVECTPSVVDCQTAEVVPIIFPAADDPRVLPGRNTTEVRLSPDDEHIAWTSVRIDAGALIGIGELRREADHYSLANPEALASPTLFTGTPDALTRPISSGGEVKQFADGGKSLMIATGTGDKYPVDVAKVDLATGDITFLTNHPGWNETGIFSPDNNWFMVLSSRFEERDVSVFGLVPRPTFMGDIGNGIYELAFGREGRDRDRGPLLLDKFGDRGDYFGQNMKPTDGYYFRPLPEWHPDGTKLVWWELKKDEHMPGPDARIRVTELLDRSPVTPTPVTRTPDAPWASSFADFVHGGMANGTGTLHGEVSGQTDITTAEGSAFFLGGYQEGTFMNHSDDGRTWANGWETFVWQGGMTLESDVRVHGCDQGLIDMTVIFSNRQAGEDINFVQEGSTGVSALNGRILRVEHFLEHRGY